MGLLTKLLEAIQGPPKEILRYREALWLGHEYMQNKAENTARKYLNQLIDMGILELRSIQGHNYYLNLELYRILGE